MTSLKGLTYFCTDVDGNTYSRYSVNHVTPHYFSATIFREEGGVASKAGVTYTKRVIRSAPMPTSCTKAVRNTADDGYDWVQVPATTETVAVRSYFGRLKVEPSVEVA